jgi:uncharacterized membrane protein YphA (DoxX/SURF4 family)
MNSLTKLFLVLLRLAIGWHFLFEGWEKINSVDLGPTATNRPWTSEPYLREATGPMGDFFRRQIGDLDEAALARLTVPPLPAGQDPARTLPYARFPPALDRVWKDYFDRFVAHYHLGEGDGRQLELAEKVFQQREDRTADWLLHGKKKVTKTYPAGTVEVEETTPQRVDEYRRQLDRLRAMENQDLPAFGRDVRKEQLRNLKADVARARTELLRDLDEQTAEMHNALQDVLTPEQRAMPPVPERDASRPIERIDFVTRWGLTAVGACLLVGLLTRTACLAGAAFLLLFYLTMPPFPWVPENLRTEGHYLFVNKNLIELLALLALATTRSGRWVGLDGILQFFNPRRRRERPAPAG